MCADIDTVKASDQTEEICAWFFGEAAGEVIGYSLAKAELVMASDLTLLFGILSFLAKPC